MAFIVEDGTIVANANAYITVAEYKAHQADRGQTVSATDAAIEGAIVRATDYVNIRWGRWLLGYVQDLDQSLDFPRIKLKDNRGRTLTGIPAVLKKAVAEYTTVALSQDLMPTPTIGAAGRIAVSERTKVGPIEEEVRYSEVGGIDIIVRPYPIADRWMRDLVSPVAYSGGVRERA